MLTPIHVSFNLILYFLAIKSGIVTFQFYDIVLLAISELIDLDHLFSKPIYHPKRNPFTTHVLHKRWKVLLGCSLLLLIFRNTLFLGIGLISHIFLDYVYVKRNRL